MPVGETLQELRVRLRRNLDDPNFTSFTDQDLNGLINESLNWVVNRATTFDYFYRTTTHSLIITQGVNQDYFVPNNTRHIILIERVDNNLRIKGTLIPERQKNDFNPMWTQPIMYLKVGANGTKQLVFATKDWPQENMELSITYAPEILKLFNDSNTIIDIDQEFIDLIILRATVQGYGGEKNVDQFWLGQYQTELQIANNLFTDRIRDEVQFVRQISNDYY